MGLDQTLNWIGEPSKSQIARLKHKDLFDTAFPEEWCEYKKKYRALNCGYYPIVGLLGNMQKVDSDFAGKYREGTDNIFYKGYW